MLLCYITDRTQLAAEEAARRERLLARIGEAARAGVDYIQLRERDLSARELEELARESVRVVRAASTRTRILINSRSDVALAAGADGVHLRADDISAADAREIFRRTGRAQVVIGVSCHTSEEVAAAATAGADYVIFAPVFEKSGAAGVGLEALRAAVARAGTMPLLALGGVTVANAAACITAGAAGVAGIRLFQKGDIQEIVGRLRNKESATDGHG